MAIATRHDGKVDRDELPEDMEVFTVVEATIVDSLGAYCTEGQEAALNETDATHYHKLKLVQAALPEFKKAATAAVEKDAADAKPATLSRPKTAADAGKDSGKPAE